MRVPPWLVFCISLSATLWLFQGARRDNAEIQENRFHNQVEFLNHQLLDHLDALRALLHGCDGLFAASQQVTREEWSEYVRDLDVEKALPGVQGFGFAQRVLPVDLADHVRIVRTDGLASYSVQPTGEREEFFPITFQEPFQERDSLAFGRDLLSEPGFRSAMERARDEN